MDHHDYDSLSDEQKAALDPVEWLREETTIRMGCGCPCTIRPGDTLWVLENGPYKGMSSIPLAVSRGTIH